ncbi:MAG: response regulator [Bdellovibrionia bacterium]
MAIDPRLEGKKILIVDDEIMLRNVIAKDFRNKGCITFEAADGNEAFKIIEANHIDLVLSDIQMPNCTGVQLLENLKKCHPQIPIVILITGYADIDKEEVIRQGAYKVLGKPIDRQKMFELAIKSLQTS